ncbi:MFS transporter [Kaistia sp. 32K]|uniref:MFS transporter n=1 Tax=Kaistia sp. 32K TaxID=2795690 RepID=UPI001914E8EE|nr:MFS transporter [Kaistia sp. 32K]BCP52661.1 MFS transporter [Kaistia sp. 32K]
MVSSDLAATSVPGAPEQLSTRIAFFIAGFGMAAWAPLVPFAKARAGLDDGALGLLLLCLGAGSIVSMPLSGALAARFGCRRIIIAGVLMLALALPLLATLSSFAALVPALLLFGAGVGLVDCVVNIQAVIVERASGRTMMSGFHGLFSVGGIVGAGGVSLALAMGASPFVAALLVVALVLVAIVAAAPNLLRYGSSAGGPAFAVPHGVVLFIGVLCFIVFLTEGAVLDWSAVFLTQVRNVDPTHAGLGYTAFAITMTIGRLTGDWIVRRAGQRNVLVFGGLCAAAGLVLATLVPVWEAGLLGYALVGAGCSNVVPVLYSAVGRQNTMPEHIAIPAVTTLGYAGILAGPAAIGFVAHASSLSASFLIIAALLVGVAVSSRWLRL